jgi:hypothetical protein
MRYTREDEIMEDQPLISTVTVGTDPTPLPATPLVGRNMLLIQNTDNLDVMLCNADGNGTLTIEPGDNIRFPTKNEIPLFYAKVADGSASIEIMEWA